MAMGNVTQSGARKEVANLQPYLPGMTVEALRRKYKLEGDIVKLASNENPYGPSPLAVEAVQKFLQSASQYPDNHHFIAKAAQHVGLDPQQIVPGNGSNDVLDMIARVYLQKGDEAISSQFAFAAYGIATTLCGARNVITPARDYGHDLDAMVGAISDRTKIIWIANPNNPTGTFIEREALKKFIDRVPSHIIVVLDEAYCEYLDADYAYDSSRWLDDYQNLIIVRTLSKIYGLAGLRIGYALSSKTISDYLNRARQPFNVNTLGLIAGTAALDDRTYIEMSYKRNKEGLTRLLSGLKDLSISVLPAFGNFITARFGDSKAVNEKLLQNGVIVRPLAGYDMPEFLRITVGTESDISKVLALLEAMKDESLW